MPAQHRARAPPGRSPPANRSRGRSPWSETAARSPRSPSRCRARFIRSAESSRSWMVKSGIEPDRPGMVAQQPRADRMEGPGPGQPLRQHRRLRPHHLRGDPLGPPGHLRRGAAREGHQQDPPRVGAAEHQLRQPVHQRVGLAGARPGDHQQRPARRAAPPPAARGSAGRDGRAGRRSARRGSCPASSQVFALFASGAIAPRAIFGVTRRSLRRRPASNRNQIRCSPSSIQFSSRLAVATSLCSSQTSCVDAHRRDDRGIILAQLGQHVAPASRSPRRCPAMRCSRAICPIERSVVPPSLRARSAMRIGRWRRSAPPARRAADDSRGNAARTCASGSSWSSGTARRRRRAAWSAPPRYPCARWRRDRSGS